MSTPSWDRIASLFSDALAQPPGARPAFLDGAHLDPAVREEVVSLLAAHEASADFLERASALARLLDALAWPGERTRSPGPSDPRPLGMPSA